MPLNTDRGLNFANQCAIPPNVKAYAANVTLIPASGNGPDLRMTVWPTGYAQPAKPTLLNPEGRLLSDHLILPANSSGGITMRAAASNPSGGGMHFLVDVSGYWMDNPNGYVFFPVPPCRLADTRSNLGGFSYNPPLDSGLGPVSLPAKETRAFPVGDSKRCGTVPKSAAAYMLNVTVKPPGPLGWLTVWPKGETQPLVSLLNDLDGRLLSNNMIVQNKFGSAGNEGSINFYASDQTDVFFEITGYFAPQLSITRGMVFKTIVPCRLVDSVSPTGSFPIQGWSSGNTCGTTIPATAEAVAVNATIRPSGLFGYLTMWPYETPQPVISLFNALEGQPISNAAIMPLGRDASLSSFGTHPGQLDVDAFGYFTFPEAANPVTEINLGWFPVDRYQLYGPSDMVRCSTDPTVRDCYRRLLNNNPLVAPPASQNYVSQGVTGVRFIFGVGGGYHSNVWLGTNSSSPQINPAWESRFRLLMSDLKSWGIKRVAVTPAPFESGGNDSYTETGKLSCDGIPLTFFRWLPFGIRFIPDDPATPDNEFSYGPDCYGALGNVYSTAARGSQFWGWGPYFQMWGVIFKAIKDAGLEVSAIDLLNEMDLVDIPVQARLIHDCPTSSACVDVLDGIRRKAAENQIDSRAITYSTPTNNPAYPYGMLPPASAPGTSYCISAYGHSALLIRQSALVAAFDQKPFGKPPSPSGQALGMECGVPDAYNPPLYMQPLQMPGQLPVAYDRPRVVDIHTYPCVSSFKPNPDTGLMEEVKCNDNSLSSAVPAIAYQMFSDFWWLTNSTGQTGSTLVLGELTPVKNATATPPEWPPPQSPNLKRPCSIRIARRI